MKTSAVAYFICKTFNAPLVLECDSSELCLFFEEQYASLPGYIRMGFWGLYFWLSLKGRKMDKILVRWKSSSVGPFREFIQYHLTLLALFAYSSPEER